ncbi:MAG: DUF4340 domain-containing protein [Acutalibacteraceae bacterium]
MSDFPEKENKEQENINEEPVLSSDDEGSTIFSDPAEQKKTVVKQKKKLLPVIIAAVLSVAVLSCGTVAVIKLIPEREEDSSIPTIEKITVLDEESDDFKTVTVTNENGTFKLYSVEETKDSDSSDSSDTSSSEPEINWYLDGYDKEVIDSSSVGYIAGYAESIEATREITTKTAAECGLESPEVRVDVVKNDGSEFSILVGNESPDGTGTYVKLSTGEKIYVTESDLKGNFTFDALSLAETDSVPGVTVTDAMKDYVGDDGALSSFDTITLTGKNFPEKVVLAPNTDENLSAYATYMTISPTKRIADNVGGIFGLFQSGVSASGAYSFDTSVSSRKEMGLDNPDLTATIKIGSFTAAYSFKQQEDGDYAVWYEGAKLIKKVSASSISFIDYKVNDYYASWVCLQSINELSNFTIKTPDKTYSFDIAYDDSEDAEETYVITYEGTKLVAENFQNFYQECISLSCSDYTVDNVSGEPAMSIIFTYSDTSRGKTAVEFRKASETKYQYRIDGIDMGKINSSSLNKILKQVEKVANGESVS